MNPFTDDEDFQAHPVNPPSHTQKYKSFIYKYRPREISDIFLPEPLALKINSLVCNEGTLPNMLITGQPGTGKTATIKLLAKKVYGKYFADAVMELNASDNRGLEIINNSIIYFCKKKLDDDNGKPITKLVIMDEADNITKKAQNMISNFMEEYSNNTNFVFTCNDSNKLIESIQSRCFILYFPYIKPANIIHRLEGICKKENVNYDYDALNLIATNSNGDMRQAIITLDVICHGKKYSKITADVINSLSHQPKQTKIIELIKLCAQRNLNDAISIIKELKAEGYCGSDILLNITNIINHVKIDEEMRLKYIKSISKSYIDVSDGIDTNLQIYSCLANMVLS